MEISPPEALRLIWIIGSKIHIIIQSESISSNSLGKLDISGHDGDSLGVDSAQVGVFEKGHEVSFSSFLEGKDS